MFGFKDGTNNLKAEDAAALSEHVWVQPGDVPGASAWMSGGSYLVARRIRMHIEIWDRTPLQEQQEIIGRDKGEGAPLGQQAEFDTLDFAKKGADGKPAIPVDAHVALAHESRLNGIRILRRGYNFTDGSDGVGHLDAGLFFIGFMRDAAASSSCRCSARWPPRTGSTSTSSTPGRRSSPARPAWARTSTGVRTLFS